MSDFDEAAVTRVQALVERSIGQGAALYVGGCRTENGYRPTLLSTGEHGRALINEEVFGPVTQIEPFEQLEAALASAARTGTALQAGLFTDSHKVVEACRLGLEVGALMVNDSSDYRVDTMPFGGPGTSGIGREGVAFTAHAYTEPQLVCYPN
jgi:glyceraldehyde-3-phosphate dehydrogenase (NADP+)